MTPIRTFHHTLHHPTVLVGSPEGAFPLFAPTRAKLDFGHVEAEHFNWTSRNHRKQRHLGTSPPTGRSRHVTGPFARMSNMTQLEYWNVSWWVAVLFTLGSVVWVINGFIVFLPLVTSVKNDPVAGGWSAWVGATIFAVGSVFLVLEAWNRDDAADFGQAFANLVEDGLHKLEHTDDLGSEVPEKDRPKLRWIWWSTDRKYWHELGFLASFVQLLAATIFWISGFTGIPQILDELLKHRHAVDGIYWTPQVIGGCGFIISSVLFILETQRKWYLPAIDSLGWHVGFWNLIGALGFTLCGALGFSTSKGAIYQSALSTFWGSWAFLVGSIIQWYEAVNPVRTPSTKLAE